MNCVRLSGGEFQEVHSFGIHGHGYSELLMPQEDTTQ